MSSAPVLDDEETFDDPLSLRLRCWQYSPRPIAPLFRILSLALALCPLLWPCPSHGQAYFGPVGNYVVAPGSSFPLTLTIAVPYGNPVIWVNGVAHPGASYTIVTSAASQPQEFLYWATVTLKPYGQTIYWDSRVQGSPGRPGDLISINAAVTGVAFLGDRKLYQRDWTDGTLKGRDVPEPAAYSAAGTFPGCYVRGNPIQLRYTTAGNGANNGVTVEYQVSTELSGIWNQTTPWTGFSPGASAFTITTPNLPDYIYRHTLFHRWFISVVFAYDPPSGDRERRVINTYDTIATPIYAVFVFDDFPPYHNGDDDARPLQSKPWVEILDNAMTHATVGLSSRNVTSPALAMANLTNDLYVWPARPDGPGDFTYWPYGMTARKHYAYNKFPWDPNDPQGPWDPDEPARFELWRMAGQKNGNCEDFAAYLEAQARSLGITNVAKVRLFGDITTGYVKFCGDNIWRWNALFAFHQMVSWPTGTQGWEIYDFALAFQGTLPPWYCAAGLTRDHYVSILYVPPPPPQGMWGVRFALGDSDPYWQSVGSILSSKPNPPPPPPPPDP